MDKTEESLIESRKKLKKYISNLELKIEVIQEVIKDTETLVKELKNAFIRVDEEIKKFRYEDNPDKLCYYEDIADTHSYLHKFGGYPSYCQSGLGLEAEENYYFVFQISSDNVARYNVVDSGSLMFFYNENENKWVMYYDFY